MTQKQTCDRFVVTGGAGFIGSHMVDYLLEQYPQASVTCLDKISYASEFSLRNLNSAIKNDRFNFERLDLAQDFKLLQTTLRRLWETSKSMTILHFAAESSVDRSFEDPLFFTKNNILATQNLLEEIRLLNAELPCSKPKISLLHISTDEVYGEQKDEDQVNEKSRLEPSNPYSATKAACDLIVGAYVKSFVLSVFVIRANNVYGPRQYPEKLIAATLNQLRLHCTAEGMIQENRITLHGDGSYKRRYLHVSDFVKAVDVVLKNSKELRSGEIYNIGSDDEWANKALVERICEMYMKKVFQASSISFTKFYQFGEDRPYNDSRYSTDCTKILKMGWRPQIDMATGILQMIEDMISGPKENNVL